MNAVCARLRRHTAAAPRRQFSVLRSLLGWGPPQQDHGPQRRVAGGAGLPAPEEAQQLPVVRIPGLLSEDEIRQVLSEAAAIRRDGAGAVRLQSSPSSGDGPSSWDPEGYEVERGEWSTTYLQTEHMFQSRLPEIHTKLTAAAVAADRENWGICAAALAAGEEGDALRTRVVELHTVGVSGGLPHPRHYDAGSCVTIDVMLSEPDQGGSFETMERGADGTEALRAHEFRKGDAVCFPSHKYHCVQPVEAGTRVVLIMELWVGEERRCNHRCEQHFGHCGHARGVWNSTTGSSVAW